MAIFDEALGWTQIDYLLHWQGLRDIEGLLLPMRRIVLVVWPLSIALDSRSNQYVSPTRP